MQVIVAIPTIKERGDSWQEIAEAWYESTPEPVICVPSWREGGWCAGLNEVWENHPAPDLFVCGSDDMKPRRGWLEPCRRFTEAVIAPQVHDPRFSRFDASVRDGDSTDMSSFPLIPGRVLSSVFPLPANLHYYGDNLISDRARKAGFPTVAVPSCVIDHLMDERGRGAGMDSESERMVYDRQLYRELVRGNRKSVGNP